MPGILGIIRPQPFQPEVVATLDRMAEPLRYAPDQTVQHFQRGRFAGSVVDYGPRFEFLKSAVAERDGVLLLMDGEVFPDASEVPHELQGDSPTVQRAEYCLHLYLERGPQFVKSLNGTFAIAVYDRRDHTVHLYNDRFGHRLLFVVAKGAETAFASSVRSVLRWRRDVGRNYDERSVAEFMLFERILADRTLFPDVRRLLPATHAVWTGSEWRMEQYFEVHKQAQPGNCRTWKEGARELLHCLRQSLAKRTADRGRPGLLLSGGLDSRLVMLACPVLPITASFSASDGPPSLESRIAASVARTYGTNHIWLLRDADYYASIAEEAISINDGLSSAFVGCHTLGVHQVMAEAGIQITLTGDRFDAALKDYWAGLPIGPAMYPTGPPELHARRLARVLADSPLIRRGEHQDLMMLALNSRMKEVATLTKGQTISSLQEWCREEMHHASEETEGILRPLALDGVFWQGFTSMGLVRGLASEFVERSPFFDNEMLHLALSLPASWALRGRLVRYAIKLASPKLARIRDVNTRLPAGLCPPWDRFVSVPRQHVLGLARRLSTRSKHVANLRQPLRGTCVLPSQGWLFSHDAALVQCHTYRSLVETAIENMSPEFFDVPIVRMLLEDDLGSDAPRLHKLFHALVSFSCFDMRWGPGANRGVPEASDAM